MFCDYLILKKAANMKCGSGVTQGHWNWYRA